MTDRALETVGAQASGSGDWAASEAASQNLPMIRVADASNNAPLAVVGKPIYAKGIEQGSPAFETTDGGWHRVFGPGAVITNGMIEDAGIANNPDQLNLERNLLYRDANPKAYFGTPGLNDKIDRLTGTQGDGSDPANLAVNMELTGVALANAQVLRNHEAVARLQQWRAANQDKASDDGFPPRLSAADIANETSPVKIQAAINALYAEKGQPMLSEANMQNFGKLIQYQPDANFNEDSAFASSVDRDYRQLLLDKRKALSSSQ